MTGTRTLTTLLEALRPKLLELARYWCGSRFDPEDLVQDACLWASARAFAVMVHKNPPALLQVVMYHRFLDRLRRNKSHGEKDRDLDQLIDEDVPLVKWMEREHLEKGVQQLPPELERVIRLRLEDRTFAEIAKDLSCTLAQAYKLYRNALVLLEKYLEKLHKES